MNITILKFIWQYLIFILHFFYFLLKMQWQIFSVICFQIMCGLNPLCFYRFDTMSHMMDGSSSSPRTKHSKAFQQGYVGLCLNLCVRACERTLSKQSPFKVRDKRIERHWSEQWREEDRYINVLAREYLSCPVCGRIKKGRANQWDIKTQQYDKSTNAEIQLRFLK